MEFGRFNYWKESIPNFRIQNFSIFLNFLLFKTNFSVSNFLSKLLLKAFFWSKAFFYAWKVSKNNLKFIVEIAFLDRLLIN